MQFLEIFLQLRWKPKRLTASDTVTLLWYKWYNHYPFGVSKGEARTEFAEILEKVRTSVRIDMREGLPYAVRSNLQSLAGADIREIKEAVE